MADTKKVGKLDTWKVAFQAADQARPGLIRASSRSAGGARIWQKKCIQNYKIIAHI